MFVWMPAGHAGRNDVQKKSLKPGFTMIEIIFGFMIITIVLAVALPFITNQLRLQKMGATKAALRNLDVYIQQYQLDTGEYPTKLRDLVKRPTDERIAGKWSGYMKEEPKDSWGNRFQYRRTDDGKHPYELYSFGPNGKGAPAIERISIWNL